MADQLQITLVRIDHYGPWTLKLGHDREHRLQILQAQLCADLQKHFSQRGGLLFNSRQDQMLAISNGITWDEHRDIQDAVHRRHPVTVSMGIGVGKTPYRAQEEATKALQGQDSSRSSAAKKIVRGHVLAPGRGSVRIAHLDIEDSTKHLTNPLSAYEAVLLLQRLFIRLSQLLLPRGALVFYLGGDNYMVVSNGVTPSLYKGVFRQLRKDFDLSLKGGVGEALTARRAAELATTALDLIRLGRVPGSLHYLKDKAVP